jgi:hypothetical protein
LNALTGWIPDKIDLKDEKFDSSRTFKALQEKYNQGMVLITVATGSLPEAIATRAGLVPNHAYAMLDLREAEVWKCGNYFLLAVVNSLTLNLIRWKGKTTVAVEKSVASFALERQFFGMRHDQLDRKSEESVQLRSNRSKEL